MSDEFDDALALQEHSLKVDLTNRKPEGPGPRGYCLECGDEDVGGRRWCSAKCARDWERREVQRLGR
ncbi:hypothetical protein [Aliidiomarina maris]|uniref:Uncharacterized protein n=1 Tax=Aliidiomarina maris TaxID=531312 RepID=A0A327X3U0_9GAMM|nr:hypothetical protein [Aliidiomarina maris]RAK01627.1 hypothetical protein B0I24_101250 [Aliidiomarina maris]RUO28452.1 hypothetical protein CWE07_01195 [Aliidiomarina maris]